MEISTCQFNDSYFPIMDGVGMSAHNYAYWLNRKYGKSSLVAPKIKGYKDHAEYKVYRFKSVLLPGMNPYRIGLPLIDTTFKRKIRDKQFDLIHAHCPFVSGQLALKLSEKLTIPLVATFHTKYKEDFRRVVNNNLIEDFLMKYTLDFYQRADYVWVPNKATGVTLREYGYRGNYDIVQNGTDMEVPEKSKLLTYRKKGQALVGIDGKKFMMLFVGQMRWEKNVKLIIDALKILESLDKDFIMVFVGEGYAEGGIKKLVDNYHLRNHVKFLGVIHDRKVLRDLYSASDLFIFPSLYDNSPLVIQEAAAFNVPSIVLQKSNCAESIVDGVSGFLIDENAQSLADRIDWLMDNPGIIRLAGEGARKSIHKPWEVVAEEVYHRYVDILKAYHPSCKNPDVFNITGDFT